MHLLLSDVKQNLQQTANIKYTNVQKYKLSKNRKTKHEINAQTKTAPALA